MEITRVVWGFIGGLPTIILTLLLAAFPGSALPLLIILGALWIAMAFAWLILKNRQLQTEIKIRGLPGSAKSQKPEPEAVPLPAIPSRPEPGWSFLEEIDLLLDGGWEATRTYWFSAGSAVRTTVTGGKRFIVHLATLLPKRKFRSIESSGQTTRLTTIWNVKTDGDYAFVIEPMGNAPFHVLVRVEEDLASSISRGIRARTDGLIPP